MSALCLVPPLKRLASAPTLKRDGVVVAVLRVASVQGLAPAVEARELRPVWGRG